MRKRCHPPRRISRGILPSSLAGLLFVGLPSYAQTTITVNATASNHSISPYVYGVNWPNAADYANLNLPIARAGGENIDEYNWQSGQNACNTASDWYFESMQQTGGSSANGDYDAFINAGKATGTQSMITVPMLPYIAKVGANGASTWSYSIAKYGAQTGHDPYNADAGNGVSASTGQNITSNSPLDAYVANSGSIQSGMVNNLISTFGNSQNGGVKYYIMDNEPSIWDQIHRDIHSGPVNYQELYNDYLTYALAVRNADSGAQIVGDEEWGWSNYWYDDNGSADYTANGNMYLIPWLMQQLHNYQNSTGKQLLNVLSVHFYAQDGSDSNTDNATQNAIRNQSTRALWDPNYVDQSWIGTAGINGGKPELIPLMQSWINTYYPGLGTAITEYNWGDDANLNGATTQADVLGIFGRQNLTIGTRWPVPASNTPTYLAFEIYRNYDGSKSTFGDTSCSDTVPNPDNLSSFAATRSSDGALTVMVVNKVTSSAPITIGLQNFSAGTSASVYQISSATQTSISHLASVAVSGNAISTTVPAQSITLFVIPKVGDAAEYNFESGTQGGAATGAPVSSVATSTAQHYAGAQSLAVNISGAAGTGQASVSSPSTPAGKTVTFHVWIPSGSSITGVQPYVMDHNWAWTGNYQAIGNLKAGAWNSIAFTVPSTAAMPLQQMGVQFSTSATWTGTCYLDSISW